MAISLIIPLLLCEIESDTQAKKIGLRIKSCMLILPSGNYQLQADKGYKWIHLQIIFEDNSPSFIPSSKASEVVL